MERSSYWMPCDWKVIDERECHFYDSNETPFFAVNVQIGEYDRDGQTYPMTRWITQKEYEYYQQTNQDVYEQYRT